MKKVILSLAVVLCAFVSSYAQINLKSVSVGASYFKPSLDYWNNSSFLTGYNGTGEKFSGSVMPTVGVELGLSKNISLGARAGFWSNSVSGTLSSGGVSRTEKLELSIIPVSLEGKYSFSFSKKDSASSKAIIPYFGVGVTRYFIQNKFTRTVANGTGNVNESQNGNSYGIQILVGAEKRLFSKVYLGVDVRYHLGSYNQKFTEGTTSSTQSISLNGLEAGLAVRYKFN